MQNKNIGWQRIILIIIPYFIIVGIFELTGSLLAGIDLTEPNLNNLTSEQHLTLGLFGFLGTFLLLWIFMKFVDRENFIKLGFQTKNRLKEFNYGIIISALIMAIGYLLLLFLNEINFKRIVVNPKEIILSILVFIIVAVVEEVLFRGYLLRNLMLSFNKYIALIVSSIIFTLVHAANPNFDLFSFFDLFLGGILLGTSYIFTKNLWFPIALHFSWNLFQTLLGFNVSGQDFYSLIEFDISQNNLLNGGNFGFEGSIFSIIAQIIAIVLIWTYYNQKNDTHTTV